MKSCFRWCRSFCGKVKEDILEDKTRLKGFRENWSGCVSAVCAYLACVAALIGFFVFYGLYIVKGGYPAQLEALKASGLDESITGGTVILMYRSFVGYLVFPMIGLSAMFAVVELFLRASVLRKSFMAVDLFLFVLSTGFLIFLAVYMDSPRTEWRDKVDLWMFQLMTRFRIEEFYKLEETLLLVSLGISVAAIVVFVILAQKKTVSRTLFAAVFSLGLLPLLLFVLENLLFIAFAIVFSVLLWVVLKIIVEIFLSGLHESGEGGASSKSVSKSTEKKKSSEKKEIRVIQIGNNQRIYIDEGNGFAAPMTKCVFTDTSFINHKYLCTLKELQSGQVKIMQGGKEIHVS